MSRGLDLNNLFDALFKRETIFRYSWYFFEKFKNKYIIYVRVFLEFRCNTFYFFTNLSFL